MPRHLCQRAFTLVEVLVSLSVLAVALLGVMGTLAFGAVAGDTAGNFSTATHLGREVVENIRIDRYDLNPFNPPAGLVDLSVNVLPRKPLNAAPLDGPMMRVFGDTRFTRNIEITQVDPVVGPLTPNAKMVRIQVRIYWIQNGKEKYVETVGLLRSGR